MSKHRHDDLSEFLLGTLVGADREAVEAHLHGCRECAQELETLSRGLLSLDRGAAPPARGLARLADAMRGSRRFEHFVPPIADLFQFDDVAARALLEQLDATEGWEAGPAEGIHLLPVLAGSELGPAITAVVKLEPGSIFPEHEHPGTEQVLVIQGGYRELESGTEVWRGDLSVRPRGSMHAFQALDGPPCICLSVLRLDEAADD